MRKRQAVRVIVNELQMLKQRTGIGHYTAELLRSLRSLAADDQIDGFPTGWLRRATALSYRLGGGVIQGQAGRSNGQQQRGLVGRFVSATLAKFRDGYQEFLARRFLRRCAANYDLYHEPNYLPMPADCPVLATLHDLSLLLHPHWHPVDRVRRFEARLPEVLARCTHFLADTESVRQEVIDCLGVSPHCITRVHMGVRSDLRRMPARVVERGLRELGLPRDYLLYLGTIEPRKNVLRLMQVYCGLPDPVRARWPLVLAGGWGWNAGEVRQYLDEVGRHRGVLHLGYVADQHLPVLYNGARALLFPTYYEGFGLPPLEMMACGGAVIASTAAAVREVAGRQAHLIDPEDSDGWRSAMLRVISDDDWRQSLREGAIQAAQPYTWERCAAETLQVYRLVFRKTRGIGPPFQAAERPTSRCG
jgi:alpha-1,3-rhamnosyl/mannosyltransferase